MRICSEVKGWWSRSGIHDELQFQIGTQMFDLTEQTSDKFGIRFTRLQVYIFSVVTDYKRGGGDGYSKAKTCDGAAGPRRGSLIISRSGEAVNIYYESLSRRGE
jgi:hypothetical protein